MRTALAVTTQPRREITTVAIARRHCRIDHTDDDALLAGYIATARTWAESYLSRALITQTLLWTVLPEELVPHRFAHMLWDDLYLPRAPVQAIGTITVTDARGNETAISAATLPVVPPNPLLGYVVNLPLARLRIGPETVLADGRILRHASLDNVQVSFVAGYGDETTVPAPIVEAVLLTVAFLYEHRGDAGGELPQAAQWSLDPYRRQFLGG